MWIICSKVWIIRKKLGFNSELSFDWEQGASGHEKWKYSTVAGLPRWEGFSEGTQNLCIAFPMVGGATLERYFLFSKKCILRIIAIYICFCRWGIRAYSTLGFWFVPKYLCGFVVASFLLRSALCWASACPCECGIDIPVLRRVQGIIPRRCVQFIQAGSCSVYPAVFQCPRPDRFFR